MIDTLPVRFEDACGMDLDIDGSRVIVMIERSPVNMVSMVYR